MKKHYLNWWASIFVGLGLIIGSNSLAATAVNFVSDYYHDTYLWNGVGQTASWFEGARKQSSFTSAATGWIFAYNGVTTGYIQLPIPVINQRTWIEWTAFDMVRTEDSIHYTAEVVGAGAGVKGASIWLKVDQYTADPVLGAPTLIKRNQLIGPNFGPIGGQYTISVPSQSKVKSLGASAFIST